MEVSMDNFWRQLPRILLSIAESQFVAIDVEMTGIMDKISDLTRMKDSQTRQELYEAGKRVASTYNIFQLGFTCIRFPDTEGSYKTESYSLQVSPILLEDTREDDFFARDVDRKMTFSLNTLKFLRREGLPIGPLTDGCVPYLSRKEAREATERLELRMQQKRVKDHQYNEDDEGLDLFTEYVWDAIMTWLDDSGDDRPSEIKIHIPPSESKRRASVYHKIVRTTAQSLVPYMRCRTWNYGATVLIYLEDPEGDQERYEASGARLLASLSKQTGIRLIIEALAGGDFADIVDPAQIVEALSAWPGGQTAPEFCEEVRRKLAPELSTNSGDIETPAEDSDREQSYSDQGSETSSQARRRSDWLDSRDIPSPETGRFGIPPMGDSPDRS